MVRTIGSSGVKTMEAIRDAGLRLIYEQGYDAMSLRALAAEVGIQQGSLYNYFRTKQDFLFMLVKGHMEDLMAALEVALEGREAPLDSLKAFIAFHIDYHTARKYEVFVNYSELRSFTRENYRTIVGLRRDYEKRLSDIIVAGQEHGIFAAHDAKIATYGILSMLSGICQWFQPDGRLSKEEIVKTYMNMVLGALQPDKNHVSGLCGRDNIAMVNATPCLSSDQTKKPPPVGSGSCF